MTEQDDAENLRLHSRIVELKDELDHKRNEVRELKAVLEEQAKLLIRTSGERDQAERQREVEFNAKLDVQKQVARLQDEIALLRKSHGGLDHAWIDLANRTHEFERRRDNHLANRMDAMRASIYGTLIRIRAERYAEGPNYVEIRDCEADFALAKKATDTYWRLKGED